jgi:hypothetical protein
MPANKKYLTKSPLLRLAKILAGTVGGYAVMLSFHLLLSRIFPREDVIVTSFFTGYILWAILLLCAFLVRNVWKVWLAYVSLTLLFSLPFLISS